MSRPSLWTISSYWILTAFLAAFLFLGVYRETSNHISFRKKKDHYKFPDFNRIYHTRTLEEQQVSSDANDRIIIIGDVHGMNNSVHNLLNSLSYNQNNDILIFAGDLTAKSTLEGSLSFLDFVTQNRYLPGKDAQVKQERIFAVRGNHDHLVIQWRAWREWFSQLTLPLPSSLDSHSELSSNSKPQPIRTGQDFLNLIEAEWAVQKAREESDAEEWVYVTRKRAEGTWREEWWRRIPTRVKGKHKQEWKMFGDHYWLAREMTEEHASYLASLPLVLHVPSIHTFVVHAGLLPYDVHHSPSDPRQPLTHPPKIKPNSFSSSNDHDLNPYNLDNSDSPSRYLRVMSRSDPQEPESFPSALAKDEDEETLRRLQEQSILTDVPQNTDWWNLLNIRTVRRNGEISKNGNKGKVWGKFWNDQMNRCNGFDQFTSSLSLPLAPFVDVSDEEEHEEDDDDEEEEEEEEDGKEEEPEEDDEDEEEDDSETAYSLKCRPSTVVYGHSAARGLDIKRWTKGLDTGCLYGRKLSALVLSRSRKHGRQDIVGRRRKTNSKSGDSRWHFGEKEDEIEMKVHSVRCHAPELEKDS